VNSGRLVALEGLDGCGKSTQIGLLADALRDAGRDLIVTREPTDGEHGRRIREMARSGDSVSPETELAWFMEDRREHVSEVIAPALATGQVVLTDRYFLSTVAYQGARGLAWREILERGEHEFPLPDLALLFEIEPDVGLARARARGAPLEPNFERADYLALVAGIFAEMERPYIARVDASRTCDLVSASVRDLVRERLELL
jgi:dTMP kinase